MRIRILHETVYRYGQPPTGVIQSLRLTPRNHDNQFVIDWRIDVSADCRLKVHEDAFGNIVHSFTADGPFDELRVQVDGEVETHNSNGVLSGTLERFPPSLFLRETPLTGADPAIRSYARDVRGATKGEPLVVLHALMNELKNEVAYDTNPTHVATTAAESFTLKRGVCQDLTHIFIAAVRSLGIPARYVGGYFHREDGVVNQQAGHAWAEAFVPDLGWIAFDVANGICATDAHVRIAVGLDYLGASPIRGSRYGGENETLEIAVQVAQASQQVQN